MRKLDSLLEQNKSLAHGLTLLEKYVRERSMMGTSSFTPKPLKKGPLD